MLEVREVRKTFGGVVANDAITIDVPRSNSFCTCSASGPRNGLSLSSASIVVNWLKTNQRASGRWFTRSINTIAFLTTMPTSMMRPMNTTTDTGDPVSFSA